MLQFAIAEDGTIEAIYDDKLSILIDEGDVTITRASHVEPNQDGQWLADMSPIGHNVTLGPFKLRSEALEAETAFLRGLMFS